ncbi:Ig-like domain-containing protein [Arthrobacter sp. D1-17]
MSGVLVVPVPASAAPGDVGVEGPSHTGTGTPTGSKRATSGLWFNDGSWWGNLWDTASSDFHIFRFNAATSSWVDTGVATDTRANTHHDVLWDGTTLYVASYRFVNDGLPAEPNFPTTMRRYSYNATSKTYTLRGSSTINNHRVEALTIDKDSTGRVWATWQQANRIYLNVTGTDGATWGTPFPHPAALSNVSVDDTSAVIAFGPGKIGVMWSRQVGDATDGMYWSYHVDGAANTAWTTPVAAVDGQRSGDDHMNLKWLDSSGGRVFAAIKTSFTSASQPLIQLLALNNATSAWSAHTIATVAECPNRVIVLIDESTQRLRTFATYPKPSGTTNAGVCTTSGGAIYEKSASLSDITGNFSFTTTKTAHIVDADQYVHNVTSTKQNLNSAARGTANSGLLLLADVNATSRYWHAYDPSGGSGGGDTTAPTVTGTSPADGATGVAVSANVTGTFSEAMDTSTITPATFTLRTGTATGTGTAVSAAVTYDSTNRVATLNPTADLAAGTTYTATIKGGSTGVKDAAGNTLATDKAWTFTTAAAGGGTSETVTLTTTADSYVSSGAATTNNGTSTLLGVDNSPVEVTYLKFDLSAYAGRTLESAELQLRSAGSGSTGTQNIKLVTTDTWTETGITYNNRPALGTSIGRLGPTTTNTNYTVPLTATGLAGELGQQLSLGMDANSSDGLDLNSKEAGSTAIPKLVLTLSGSSGGGTPSDTTAPTVTDTSPAAGATGVAVTANVTGTFSEAMNDATVTPETFTLSTGTTTVPAAVTYTGTDRTATLNPTADLAAGTTYTATIKGGTDGVKDAAGNTLAADKTWSFTTAAAGAPSDTTAPTVTGTSPAAGATGVAVTANVTGTFSEAMDAATITPATFTLTTGTGTGTTTVPADVRYDSTNRVVTLNPDADLAAGTAGTTYTATIKGGTDGVKDAAGNTLAADKTWTFTTAAAGGGTTETVTLTATADSYVTSGATGTNNGTSTMLGVDNSPVEVTYLKFDLSAYAGRTLESATLQLRSAGSGSTGTQNIKLAGDGWTETGITYNNRPALGTSIGTLGPTTTNTNYGIPLTATGLAGELGQQLSLGMDANSSDGLDLNSKEAGSAAAPKLVLTLSPASGGGTPSDTTAPTVTGTSPAAGATGVAVTANVTGTFSEAMDAATITPATFTLTTGTGTGTTTVPADVRYDSTNRVVTLNPDADLAAGTAGTTYTATIKGGTDGVKDAAGNTLAADKTWTFTTAAVAGGTTESVTLTATADSYVTSGATGTNNGTSTMLGVDNSPVEVTYLKFDLSAYAGRTLESATLQLRSAGSGSTGTQNIKLAGDGWTETGITYSNRPALGTSIGTLGPTTTNTNYSVPLTVSGLAGELGQQLSLGMDANSGDGLDLNSKEAGSTAAPTLVLTLTQ